MRTTHVIDSWTLPIEINGVKYELELVSPAEVDVDYQMQPPDGPYRAEAVVSKVWAADVMIFASEGVTWCYAAGEEITKPLSKLKFEQIQEAIEAAEGLAA